jgi:hypothetical protein
MPDVLCLQVYAGLMCCVAEAWPTGAEFETMHHATEAPDNVLASERAGTGSVALSGASGW